MVQARIEITPAEQLQELRRARDRYAALADRVHNSDDPDMDADARRAREQDIRRILQSYEKSIADSVVRMSSMDGTRRNVRPTLGIRTWLSILVALGALEGGILLMYFHPEFFTLSFLQRVRIEIVRGSAAPVADHTGPVFAPAAPQSAAPPQIASATPPAIAPQRPAATPKPAAPKPVARPLVTRSSRQELARPAATPKPVAPKPVTQSPPPAAAAPTPAPLPTPQTTPQTQAQTPAQAPVQTLAQPPVQTPAPSPVQAPVQAPPPVAAANPPQAAPQQQPPTRLEPIVATHTPPPYPATAKRLGETGTTRMRVAVSSLGTPTECRVVQSSGSVRLDTAACSHVQANWRWKPATRDGQPVATGIDLTVVWNLRQAP